MADSIDKILEAGRQKAATTPVPAAAEADKFFSLLGGDVVDDPFLEFRFHDGFKLCLAYHDVVWMSYDPKRPKIEMDFGSTTIVIEGRGLDGELFDGLKSKRVMWIKEADREMQDHDGNKVFIKNIGFKSPDEAEAPPA